MSIKQQDFTDMQLYSAYLPPSEFCTFCLICGESVSIDNPRDVPKICNKCKSVILKLREESK